MTDQKIVGNSFQLIGGLLTGIKASGGKLQWTSLARSATYNFLEFSDMNCYFHLCADNHSCTHLEPIGLLLFKAVYKYCYLFNNKMQDQYSFI